MGIHSSNVHNITALTSVPVVTKTLREGSVVSVRVLSRTDTHTYKAIVSGVTVQVHSDLPLQKGFVFRAHVHGQNGTIILKPENPNIQSASMTLVQQLPESGVPVGADVYTSITNEQLAAYLQALHLAPDLLSLHLVQQLQQMGARFDLSLLQKIRHLAARFSGKESLAAEIALQLELQGVEATDTTIAQLLQQTDVFSTDSEAPDTPFQSPSNDYTTSASQSAQLTTEVTKAIQSYIQSILAHCNRSDTTDSSLATFNESDSDLHWVVLPFEMQLMTRTPENTNPAATGKGVLRFFIDKREHTCKKILLSIKLRGQNAFYVLYLKQGNAGHAICHTVKLCVQPQPSHKKSFEAALCKALQEKDEDPITIAWLDPAVCTPFFTEDIPLPMVSGVI